MATSMQPSLLSPSTDPPPSTECIKQNMEFSDAKNEERISEVDDGGVRAEEEILADDVLGASAGGPDLTRKHDVWHNLDVHAENVELSHNTAGMQMRSVEDDSMERLASPTGDQSEHSRRWGQVMRWMGFIWNALCTPYVGLIIISTATLVTALHANKYVWIVGFIGGVVCLAIGYCRIMQMMEWEKDGKRIKNIDQLARLENASHLAFVRVLFKCVPMYSHDVLVEVVDHKEPSILDPEEKKHLRIYEFTAESGMYSKSAAGLQYTDIYVIKVKKEFPWVLAEENPEAGIAVGANIKNWRLYQIQNDSYSKTDEERKKSIEFEKTLLSALEGTYNVRTHNCQHNVSASLTPDRVGHSRHFGTYMKYSGDEKPRPIKLGKTKPSYKYSPISGTRAPTGTIPKQRSDQSLDKNRCE